MKRVDRWIRGFWCCSTTLTLQPGIAYADDFTVGLRDRSDITYTRAGLSGPRPEPRKL